MRRLIATIVTFAFILAGILSSKTISLAQAEREQQTNASRLASVSPSRNLGGSEMAEELGAFLEKAAAADTFSGAVLVAKDGQPIFRKAYGLANKSTNTPNSVETKFNIGSLSKMFTAVAVAQLAESGKLSFTDTVGKHLQDYPNKTVAEKVTIHHLLTHTSGIGDYQNAAYLSNLDKMRTVAELLPLFVNDPLAFEPGAKWAYSNAGYVVLGLIIEKVSGQSYFDYVKEHIFRPAGMVNTDSYEKDKNVSNLAVGYMKMGPDGRPDPSAPRRENTSTRPAKGSPAGGAYSTVDDLLRFSLALRNHKLLSEKYTDIVMTGKFDVGGPVGKYAYGFGDKVFNGRHIVGHNGGGLGIGANFDMFPELGYTAVIFTNYDPPAMMPVIMQIRGLIPTIVADVRQTNKEQPQPIGSVEQDVKRLERQWLDAYEQRDAAAMDRIVADDFSITHADGSVQTKTQIMEMLKSPRPAGGPAFTFSTEDVQARAYGDTVILTGRLMQRGERNGQQVTMQSRYTDTYVKRQGRWQVVASQLTRLPQQ